MSVMTSEQRFDAVRVHISSSKPYERLLASLLGDIGDTPVDLEALERDFDSWESYRARAESLAGPSGFMLFGLIDHGGWMRKVGPFPRSTRVILGNPALAITMLELDVNAGLFAPVELLLVAEPEGGSRVMYLKPSSLMVVETHDELLSAARILDEKLKALVLKISSIDT
jgi:uncharacterized protein (DUF302 family)